MITREQILTFLQLKGISNARVFSLCENARKENIELDSISDMVDYIKKCIRDKIIKGLSQEAKDAINVSCLIKAGNKATEIIENSFEAGINIVSFYDSQFPMQLKKITDEKGKSANPILLYYKGNFNAIPDYGIAIIGTREPTPEGITAGEFFAEKFAREGFNIISGLALGCDTSAHKGALKGNGFTTAFLAHGLDIVYPNENEKLAQSIIEKGGLLISEYPIGTQPIANYFIARDRLQSGMANATIVIQTGVTGGTMHAVTSTIEAKKPLYAVTYKGDVNTAEKVQGNVKLISEQKASPLSSSNMAVILDEIRNGLNA